MEETREKRYLEKIELIRKRSREVEEWKPGFFINEKDRLAIYKAFQEIVEACMDLITMMLKDNGNVPEDDYSNIYKAVKLHILPDDIKSILIDMNGLRNRIVHEYNSLDEKIAFDSMITILPEIDEFIGAVEKWIKK